MDKQSLGQRISSFRKDKKMSADELASLIGKDRATVYRYENGEIQDVSIYTIVDLAKALDVSPSILAGFNEGEEGKEALKKQLVLLQRASEAVGKQGEKFYQEQTHCLCALTSSMVDVVKCLCQMPLEPRH